MRRDMVHRPIMYSIFRHFPTHICNQFFIYFKSPYFAALGAYIIILHKVAGSWCPLPYQCSKGGVQPFASNSILGVKWEGNLCRYEFLLVYFDSCFILFYYSHEIHLPIFETWCAPVRKLQDFKWKISGKTLQVRVFTRFPSFLVYFVLL